MNIHNPIDGGIAMTPKIQFRLRLGTGKTWTIGPGKVALLEAIESTGSIAGAARALKMSYKRAWDLVDEMNRGLVEPAVSAAPGGRNGGGTRVTAAGRRIVASYRRIEERAAQAAAADLRALARLLAKP